MSSAPASALPSASASSPPRAEDFRPVPAEFTAPASAEASAPLAASIPVPADPGEVGWLTRAPWPTEGTGIAGNVPVADAGADMDYWSTDLTIGERTAPDREFPDSATLTQDAAQQPFDIGTAAARPWEAASAPASPTAIALGAQPAPAILAVQAPATASPTVRPALSGRRYVYTKEDFDVATTSAKGKLMHDGTYKTDYSEAGLASRDFFVDLRQQRLRDKGRQATGPIWIHLAVQAKNLAGGFSLNEILEAMKHFCSVRYEDYELYMRLLGEVPHYVKTASADQLCELIRLLSRRRLRERNYVDMIAAHLLQKIRVTDDSLPARLLVKAANAFAALECRSQPKFVEHFLRHMEHRIDELDGECCCLVSPLFVANYMSDALRRAYLKRCAETQAGFHGHSDLLRNLACTELVMRKEHHSFVVSLPSYVTRYLDKVRNHARFDGWGSVTLPTAHAPDGPKGKHKAELSLSVQRKAALCDGGKSGDVFSSEMHRDVSACLNHLGIEHENGVLCGPLLLDIVALDMVNPSRRITYEVNSPHHYYEGTQTLIAEKRLRHRMLGRLGQKLHYVHSHDWRSLTAAQKMTFMLKLQQEQQEANTKEAKQQAAANVVRAPLPSLAYDSVKKPEPFRLKSSKEPIGPPIRVPVPPSLRARAAPLTAR